MREKEGYVYIMGSETLVLYVGVTSHLENRVHQHKNHEYGGFTAKYNVTRLLYYEGLGSIEASIEREKQIKKWNRKKKLVLIRTKNPNLEDLSYSWE